MSNPLLISLACAPLYSSITMISSCLNQCAFLPCPTNHPCFSEFLARGLSSRSFLRAFWVWFSTLLLLPPYSVGHLVYREEWSLWWCFRGCHGCCPRVGCLLAPWHRVLLRWGYFGRFLLVSSRPWLVLLVES